MIETNNNTIDDKKRRTSIHLTDIQQQNLKKAMKRGIYRELHKREFLSDEQLNDLIEKNI